MKVFAFVVSLVIFVASFLAFGYAFAVEAPFHYILFALGLIGVAVALMIPFHLLERLD